MMFYRSVGVFINVGIMRRWVFINRKVLWGEWGCLLYEGIVREWGCLLYEVCEGVGCFNMNVYVRVGGVYNMMYYEESGGVY